MSNENPGSRENRYGWPARVRETLGQLIPSIGHSEATNGETAPLSEDGPSTGSQVAGPAGAPRALTDEERVCRYLRPHGGRMRQSEIVECTEWSKSKVSRLLSRMEDEGLLVRTPIGREKLVSLPGHQPEATRSALDSPGASLSADPVRGE